MEPSRSTISKDILIGLGLLLILAIAQFASAETVQADNGEELFKGYCSTCHDMKFYKSVMKGYNGLTVNDLVETVAASMPADNPGNLFYNEYIDIIAYIFRELDYSNEILTEDNIADIVIK